MLPPRTPLSNPLLHQASSPIIVRASPCIGFRRGQRTDLHEVIPDSQLEAESETEAESIEVNPPPKRVPRYEESEESSMDSRPAGGETSRDESFELHEVEDEVISISDGSMVYQDEHINTSDYDYAYEQGAQRSSPWPEVEHAYQMPALSPESEQLLDHMDTSPRAWMSRTVGEGERDSPTASTPANPEPVPDTSTSGLQVDNISPGYTDRSLQTLPIVQIDRGIQAQPKYVDQGVQAMATIRTSRGIQAQPGHVSNGVQTTTPRPRSKDRVQNVATAKDVVQTSDQEKTRVNERQHDEKGNVNVHVEVSSKDVHKQELTSSKLKVTVRAEGVNKRGREGEVLVQHKRQKLQDEHMVKIIY